MVVIDIFIKMKILLFLFTIITFTSCVELTPLHHRHVHLFHKRPLITKNWEKRYEAPSSVYKNRDFK